MGGFTVASSPSSPASKDVSDDGFDSDDADDGSPSDDEVSTWCTYPFVTCDKKGE